MAKEAQEAQATRIADAEARKKDAEEQAARVAKAAAVAAKDKEEKALPPAARTARIQSLLPNFCEAKRLLLKAPDPKARELNRARALLDSAERKQLSEERGEFEATRGLVCRDGTGSPSCVCPGKHRGCCSHHGGIAGCTPYPNSVSCGLI